MRSRKDRIGIQETRIDECCWLGWGLKKVESNNSNRFGCFQVERREREREREREGEKKRKRTEKERHTSFKMVLTVQMQRTATTLCDPLC
jgi:hypothetical protein